MSLQLVCGVYFYEIQKRLQEFLRKGSFCFFSPASRSQFGGHCALCSLSCGSYSDTASLHASGKGQMRHMLARWALAFFLHLHPLLSPLGTQLMPRLPVTCKAFHALDYCQLHGHTSSYQSRISPPINSNATHRWQYNEVHVTSIYQVFYEVYGAHTIPKDFIARMSWRQKQNKGTLVSSLSSHWVIAKG